MTHTESELVCHQKGVNVLELFDVYAMVLDDSSTVDIDRAKLFGHYLGAITVVRLDWLKKYGINQLAAAILLLVIRVCGFQLTWNSFLV